MARDGLRFAAELLHSLTPAIVLALELVWLVRWALAKLLVRLQDRAYSAVSTGYLEPSTAPPAANDVRCRLRNPECSTARGHCRANMLIRIDMVQNLNEVIIPVVVKQSRPRTAL